jgi:hypothetical protein
MTTSMIRVPAKRPRPAEQSPAQPYRGRHRLPGHETVEVRADIRPPRRFALPSGLLNRARAWRWGR